MFPFAAHFFYIMLLAKKSEASSLALLFFFISFAGWCGETLLFLIRFGQLRDRGFLTLPFCTIYGSSVLGVGLLLGTPEGGRFAPLFRRASRLRPFPRAAARTSASAASRFMENKDDVDGGACSPRHDHPLFSFR